MEIEKIEKEVDEYIATTYGRELDERARLILKEIALHFFLRGVQITKERILSRVFDRQKN